MYVLKNYYTATSL